MNILVTGANGQLGNEMRIVTQDAWDNYFFTDITDSDFGKTIYLDITDEKRVLEFVKDYNIDIIINCAAYTNVDACEEDSHCQELAERLNILAPKILANAIKKQNGWLIHISTDYVFGGYEFNVPADSHMPTNPIGIYGKTKLAGELNVVDSECNYIIIRTSWLYSEFGKNFCKTMLDLTRNREELKVVVDQCGTPTYALDLANAIYDIVCKNKLKANAGIYHFSNEGVASWYDFSKMIAKISGNIACDIQPCLSKEFPSPVKRPSYSVLDKQEFKNAFNQKIPYWIDSLEACIKRIKEYEGNRN